MSYAFTTELLSATAPAFTDEPIPLNTDTTSSQVSIITLAPDRVGVLYNTIQDPSPVFSVATLTLTKSVTGNEVLDQSPFANRYQFTISGVLTSGAVSATNVPVVLSATNSGLALSAVKILADTINIYETDYLAVSELSSVKITRTSFSSTGTTFTILSVGDGEKPLSYTWAPYGLSADSTVASLLSSATFATSTILSGNELVVPIGLHDTELAFLYGNQTVTIFTYNSAVAEQAAISATPVEYNDISYPQKKRKWVLGYV